VVHGENSILIRKYPLDFKNDLGGNWQPKLEDFFRPGEQYHRPEIEISLVRTGEK